MPLQAIKISETDAILDLTGLERVYDSILDLIPNPNNPTPMIRLSERFNPNRSFEMLLKLEGFNPFGSIKDRTLNGYDATPYGGMGAGAVVDGAVGKGLSFEGIDDCLAMADNPGFSQANGFTISAWAQADSVIKVYRIFSKKGAWAGCRYLFQKDVTRTTGD